MTEITRLELLNSLRNVLNQRIDTLYTRRKDGELGTLAEKDAIAFLCGAAAAINALGLDHSHGLTGVAFLASVRGAADFLEG